MALIVDIKVNNDLLYRLTAERFPGTKKKGLNPYKVRLWDEKGNELASSNVAHEYEDGAIKLAQRMAQEIWNSTTISRK